MPVRQVLWGLWGRALRTRSFVYESNTRANTTPVPSERKMCMCPCTAFLELLGDVVRCWEVLGILGAWAMMSHTAVNSSLHFSRDSYSSGFHPELGATAIPVSRCSACKLLFGGLNCSKTGGRSCWDLSSLQLPAVNRCSGCEAVGVAFHFLCQARRSLSMPRQTMVMSCP